MSAQVIKIGAGKNKEDVVIPVKNLGWLLRNWKKVEYFKIIQYLLYNKTELVAYCDDQVQYRTEFADFSVCLNFLNRPIFKTLEVEYILHRGNSIERTITLKIGSDAYREFQKYN